MKYRLKIEKRMEGFTGNIVLARVIAIVAAIILTIIVLMIAGFEIAKIPRVFEKLFTDTLFTAKGLEKTIVRTIPLIFCALGVAIAFRMKLWNIGGEGQFAMGAFASAGVAMAFPGMPAFPLILLMLVAGMLAGLIWAGIAGLTRSLLGVNETIVTLMLNYIALLWLQFLIIGPWKDPLQKGFPIAPIISENGWLPAFGDSKIHIGIIIAIVIAVVYYFVLNKSKWGYEVRAIGDGPKAAKYAGMNVKLNVILVMAVSGALIGLGGAIEISGISHRLEPDISSGYGFTAVIIAWLAKLSPTAIIIMSVFMAALAVGGKTMGVLQLPSAISAVIQGIILFCVLAFDFLTKYSIKFARKETV